MPQSYNFDGINRIIQLENTSSFTVLDAYSRWKDFVLTDDNSKYLPAFSYVGGEGTVGSDTLGITYFLTNGWRFRPYNSQSHRIQVIGNLFTTEGSSSFNFATGSFSVIVEQQVSNLTEVKAITITGSDGVSGTRIEEIWQLHGLDINNPLNVIQTERKFAAVTQSIVTTGTGSLQDTTITRL